MKTITTIEQFLNSTVEDYSSAYNGKDACCRCGCGGTYASTSKAIEPRSEVNDKRVSVRLSYAKKYLIENPKSISFGPNYVNISKENDRAFCFYFDEVKQSEKELINENAGTYNFTNIFKK